MRYFVLTLALVAVFATAIEAGHHAEGEKNSTRGDKRFAKIDTDGDGLISRAEFLAGAQARFGKMDKNGDGVLSKDEMKRPRRGSHNH